MLAGLALLIGPLGVPLVLQVLHAAPASGPPNARRACQLRGDRGHAGGAALAQHAHGPSVSRRR